MTIETITLCNLTSIGGEHLIDFTAEPLRSAGLFAITGDTGAGKSTLLDAICLALYGKAPRLEGVRANLPTGPDEQPQELNPSDPRTFLRRGAQEGYARVRFVVPTGERYEAHWSVRLTRNGTFARPTRALYQLLPKGKETLLADRIREVDQEVQRIVGLDYDQFVRTVLLAQNSFATFLQADSKDKSQLLEKLTGTDIYGNISKQIFALAREAGETVAKLDARREEASRWRLCEPEVQQYQESIAHLTSTIADRRSQQQNIDALLDWHHQHQILRQRLDTANETLAEINKNYLAQRGEEEKLERFDSVQEFRPLFEQINENRTGIARLKSEEQTLTHQMEEQQAQLTEADKQLLIARERKAEADTQLRIKQPDIEQGHAINGEIKTINESLNEAQQKLAQSQQRLEERTTALQRQKAETEQLKQRFETLNLRRQELAVHQSIFEQFQAVTDKLGLYNTEMNKNERLHADYTHYTQQQSRLAVQCENAEKEVQKLQEKRTTLSASKEMHRQTINELDHTLLHAAQSDTQQRLTALTEARRLWKRLVDNYTQIEERRANIERKTRKLEQKREDLERLLHEETALRRRYLTLSKTYTLSQVEEIKQLRQKLKEGTPCPVCGSAHHPYHTEVEQASGETQSQLEKDYLAAEHDYEQKQEAVAQLRQNISQSEGVLEAERSTFALLKQQLTQHEADWQLYAPLDDSFAECTPTVNRDARATTIEMLIDSANRRLDTILNNIKIYDYQTQLIQEDDRQMAQLEERIATGAQQFSELHLQLKIARERITLTHRQMAESDALLEQLYKDLDDVLTVSGWRDKNIEDYCKYLTEIYTEWKSTNAELTTLQNDQTLATSHIDNLRAGTEEMRTEVNLNREQRDRLNQQLNEKHEQLRRLFGDSSPAAVAQALQAAIDAATTHHNNVFSRSEQLNLALRHLQGKRDNLTATRQAQEETLRLRSTRLDQEIARYNLSHAPLQTTQLADIFADPRDWNALRQRLSQCRRQLLLARQDKDMVERDYLALTAQPTRPSEREEDRPDALRATREQLEVEIRQLDNELAEKRQHIARHNDSLSATQALEEELTKARDNAAEWNRLNEMFGSSDGKRFRDMAQSFTFAILVEHANYHLRQLSPRYELQVLKGSLVLEVIDHDMLDEHRYVSSLSGGETFIVSLALALGLASLSCHTLNIGSLFIDEGFGNLDQDSLAQVLTTLSALEAHQGRKVGVVSHTEQIRSQISPQIRVIKCGGDGRSRIEVK